MDATMIFSISDKPVTRFSTLLDLLRWRTLHQPEQQAYIFLMDGERQEATLTYKELDRQARAIAAHLQNLNAAGERALLLYQPGLEFITAYWGCLYAGVIAVPASMPRLNRPMPRVTAIVKDAEATIVLTTQQLLADMEQRFLHHEELKNLRYMATDSITENDDGEDWQEPTLTGDHLAFLQYTSGSTTSPKGVMVSHANLLHNLHAIQIAHNISSASVSVTWLPHFHDMGLIDGLLVPVFCACPAVCMSPLAFLQQPIRWLQAISHYGGTHSGSPNFGYELCLRRVRPDQLAELDLSSWVTAYNGAEPVRYHTMARFSDYFAPTGFQSHFFYPVYGLAESTLLVSSGAMDQGPLVGAFNRNDLEQNIVTLGAEDDPETYLRVGCGWALFDDTTIAIVNPDTLRRCAPNEVGEIWVSGPSVAQGYWKRPDSTKQTFQAYTADTNEGPFMRTGDLGFLYDGQLFIAGRLKDLIIIDGRNQYPQDIELTVEQSHEAIRDGASAAFSIDVNDKEQLVIVAELKRQYRSDERSNNFDLKQVIHAIRQDVSQQHELQIYAIWLIKTGTIPKTTSGKIQRQACRHSFLNNSLEVWHKS